MQENQNFTGPICGMTVSPETAAGKSKLRGEIFYFCSKGCQVKFESQNNFQTASKADSQPQIVQIGRQKVSDKESKVFVDPVCKMLVKPETAAGKSELRGETFYFCAAGCLNKFRQNPENFLNQTAPEPMTEKTEGVEYTCPMHPEILKIGSGICPKCGMALEPKTFSFDDAPDPEYTDMKRRFTLSAVLTIPVFLLAMSEMLPDFHGKIDGKEILIGNEKLFEEKKIGINAAEFEKLSPLRDAGQTIMFVAIDEKLAGFIGVSDTIKISARDAIRELHKQKIEVVMMIGDNENTARSVAENLGIDQVFGDVLPEQKAEKIKELQQQGKIVAMAGDGVNDAPALAQAEVGIAMGTGTDVAMESADITLLKGDLNGILKTKKLSEAVMKNIRQNLFFAFIYNLVGVPVAAGILFPFFGILLSPMIASAAMTFSSVSVILNALRLRNLKL